MHIEIKNFRGIAAASLPLDRHILVAGPNGAGKTSLSMAIAAACTGSPAPWDGVKAKDARELLRDGASRGHVSLVAGEQTVNVNYPGGSVSGKMDGIALPSSVALGLQSVATMKPADASTLLSQYMGAEPTLQDLAEAVGEAVADRIWPMIERDGWDAALAHARESGSRLKGQWEGVTGENYGSAKAQGWRPEGADAYDLSGDLQAAVDAAKAQLQEALSSQAVGHDRIERLQATVERSQAAEAWLAEHGIAADQTAEATQAALTELRARSASAVESAKTAARIDALQQVVATLPDLQAAHDTAKALAERAQQDFEECKAARMALPAPADKVQTAPCPSCGTHLVVASRSVLNLPEQSVTDEENAARALAIEAAQSALDGAAALAESRRSELQHLQSRLAQAGAAQAELRRLEAQPAAADDLPELLARAELLGEAMPHIHARDAGREAAAELQAVQGQQSVSPEAIEAAQHALHDAEIALGIRQSIGRAAKLAGQIALNAAIVAALSPAGVRQSVLSRALDGFNEQLAETSKVARWNTVKISDNMRIYYGNREYGWQLSESEKFRVRVVLQVVMAAIDGSPLIVVDAADILDRAGRNGLVALVKQSQHPVVMTMTMNQKADVPNMSALGVSSYWINQAGEIEPAH